jgi:hypothetical protein
LRRQSARTRRTNARPLARWLVGAGAALALASGCSEGSFNATLDASVQKLFAPKRTPQQYMLIAVSDADPDLRRAAVTKVAESEKYDEQWAIKGFIAIALLESDSQARCVAIRGLGKSGDPRAAETCLKILNYRRHPPNEVRPPDDLCRWDATAALAELSGGPLSDELRSQMLETLLDRLKSDPDRHVRMAAARGLQHLSDPDAVRGLIEGLRDEDFAVVHRCEQSLAWLTGVTQDCDPYLWEQWLGAHQEDLFAQGGELPDSRKPPYEGWWGGVSYKTKQFFQWAFPGRKEK